METPKTRQIVLYGMSHVRLFGITVLGAGKCQRDHRLAYPVEHRLIEFYCVIYISRGRAFFESEAQPRTECEVGDSFLLIPGHRHSYGPIGDDDFEETWISFEGPAVSLAFKQQQLSAAHPLFRRPRHDRYPLFQRAFDYAASNDIALQRQMPALYFRILSDYVAINPSGQHRPLWVDEAATFLAEHACHELNLADVASRYHVSYSTFRAVFKREFGVAPGKYILLQKMNRACEYLAEGCSVAATADAVGIDDPFYFSRLFKQHLGSSPTAYKKSLH